MDGRQNSQILPNQSYVINLSDGHTFHQNEHHITRRLSCIKPRATSEANETSYSYNLRPRKVVKHVHWLDYPTEVKQGGKQTLICDQLNICHKFCIIQHSCLKVEKVTIIRIS